MAGLGSLGQVFYDIVANDKTGTGIGGASRNFGGLVVTLGDVMNTVKEIGEPIAQAADNFREWGSEAESLSLSMGSTADEVLAMADAVHSADTTMSEALDSINALNKGYGGNQETVEALLPLYDNFADATGIEASEAVKTLSQSMKAMNEDPLTNTGKNLDILSYMMSNTNLEMGDFEKVVGRCGVRMGEMGMTTEDVVAVMMNLESKGYQGKEMIKVFSEAFGDLDQAEKASAEATDAFGETLKDLYLDEEVSLGAKDQLTASFNRYNSAADGSKEKSAAYAEMVKIVSDREGVSFQGKQKLLALLKDMDGAEGNNKGTKEKLLELLKMDSSEREKLNPLLEESVGYTEREAEAKNKAIGPAEQMNYLMEELTMQYGFIIGPLGTAVGGLNQFSGVIQTVLMGSIAFPGLLTTIAGGLTSIGSSGLVALAGLGPLLPILAGVGLGLAAVYAMQQLGILDWFYELGADCGPMVADAIDNMATVITGLPEIVSTQLGNVVSYFVDLPGNIAGALGSIGETITGAFSGAVSGIGSALSGIPGALMGAFTDITTAFSALGGSVQTAFSTLFTGIGDYIVGLAQGFISAGYNIIMFIVQGMQSAAGVVGSTISGIFGIIGQFIPHSPAETGPLSVLPNFGAYFVDPLLAITPQVQAASLQVAAAVTMPAAQPASIGGGGTQTSTSIDNGLSVGTINAKEQSISDIMAELAITQEAQRKQKGYRSLPG